ncbi:G-patch domain and KOW motifs-containing protein [Hyalella azteca]|uniref:G-patch domain and KOW motifs-containing protein n=1 Tax=Hyalella azteca TaxID=294128 RepID=A0A8B7NVL0_HYAAZ|nr:G-patch domain and KOW motifs-containing protein [Hyalella azteca]
MENKKISLSFTKVIEKKSLQPSALKQAPENARIKKEVIETIEENIIKSNAAEGEELVIPLLQRDSEAPLLLKSKFNQKKRQTEPTEETSTDKSPCRELTLDEQAEKALLEEVANSAHQLSEKPSNFSIPIDDVGPSISNLGSIPTLDDFDEIGVEQFGAALLRGMGWTKGQGVGNSRNRKVVSIIEASNKTLGSSATRKTVPASQDPHEQEETLSLKKGSYVLLSGGRHEGNYGMVESVEETHVLVKKAVGGAVVMEIEGNLTPVTKTQYADSSRVINKEMFDKFKDAEANKKKKRSDKTDDKNLDKDGRDVTAKENKQMYERDGLNNNRPEQSQLDTQNETYSIGSQSDENKLKHPRKVKQEITDDYNASEKTKSLRTLTSGMPVGGNHDDDDKSSDNYSERDQRHHKLQDAVRNRKSGKYLDDPPEYKLDRRKEHSMNSDKYSREEGVSRKQYDYDISDEDKPRKKKSRDSRRRVDEFQHEVRHHKERISKREDKSSKDYLLSKYGDASTNGNRAYESDDRAARGTISSAPWVREGLTVRITSEQFKAGKYFKEKVVVENVMTAVQCECRTSSGRLLSGVPLAVLETVIPKQHPRVVMVVKGRHAGMLGRVLEQHKSSQEASIQLLEDKSIILKLHYEQICQYNQ